MSDIKIHCKYDALIDPKMLKDYKDNPNKHGSDQIERLAKIYEYQGIRHPIIYDPDRDCIAAGHGRKLSGIRAGVKLFPVVYQRFESDEQFFAFVTSDNAIADWAELDLSGISTKVMDFGPEFDVNMLGILNFKIDLNEDVPDGDPDAVPEDVQTKSKLGDLYELENHRLICGDSTDEASIARLMNGEKADMVFTDPPYKLETEGGCKGELGKSLRKQGNDIEFISDFNPKDFLTVLPFVFEKGKINSYIFCNKELLPDYLLWGRENKYSFNVLIWKKPNAIPIGDSHRPDIEYLILFRKSAIWNNGISGINYSRCLEYGREKGLHPTMKPVELIGNEIQISSNKYSVIVDFFGGSGSTLIACEKTNRKCFMSELDPHYIDVIIQRWQTYSKKKAYRLNNDGTKTPYDEIELTKNDQ